MTTSELIAGKTFALAGAVVASLTTALAQSTPSVPLEWSGILALVTAVFGYGRLSGALHERQKADDKRYRRLTNSVGYLEACVTRVAEKLNVPLSDLQSQFQSPEE